MITFPLLSSPPRDFVSTLVANAQPHHPLQASSYSNPQHLHHESTPHFLNVKGFHYFGTHGPRKLVLKRELQPYSNPQNLHHESTPHFLDVNGFQYSGTRGPRKLVLRWEFHPYFDPQHLHHKSTPHFLEGWVRSTRSCYRSTNFQLACRPMQ